MLTPNLIKINFIRICSLLVFLGAPALVYAAPITVNVNTSSIAGTTGSLDFNFNPGPFLSQPASLQILNFSTDGSVVGVPTLTGDVSGSLPGTVSLDNGTAFNDYFQGFTFGSALSFDLNFFGPAITAPDGVSTSGSTFAFSMFSDAAGTVPVLTTDTTNGFAYLVDVNLDGTLTATNLVSNTPEPGILLLTACALAFLVVLRSRQS